MKLLVIGGTGNISTAITRGLQTQGHDLTLFRRQPDRPAWLRPDVNVLTGDRRDHAAFERQLAGLGPWDCVIDMIAFEPADAVSDIRVFAGRTRQFIFCSTVDVYDNVSELENYEQWQQFRDRVRADFVNPKDDFRPSKQNLGILDMKICASVMAGYRDITSEDNAVFNNEALQVYLRVGDQLFQDDFQKETFQNIQKDKTEVVTPFIWEKTQPLPHDSNVAGHPSTFNFQEARINYRFKIQKARKIAYIGKDVEISGFLERALMQEGVYLFKNIFDFAVTLFR